MALAITMLILFVITALGLFLLVPASTEADIATNHLWGEMAFLHAESGLEFAKNLVAGEAFNQGDLRRLLPPARPRITMGSAPADPAACPEPTEPGCRDNQFWVDQGGARVFVGRVMARPDGSLVQFDFRQPTSDRPPGDIDGNLVPDIQGTVTVWIRRSVLGGIDDPRDDRALLTAEGTAPNYGSPAAGRPGALRRVEMSVRLFAGVAGVDNSMATNNSGTGATASNAAVAGEIIGSIR